MIFRAGVAQARNFGASMANSDYIAFLDDDDMCRLIENASKKDQMLSLNLSFLDRGYSFKIMDPLDKPLVIYNYYDDDLRGKMINNSNSIEITDSKCTIIEVDIDKSKSKYFKNNWQSS